MHGLPWREAIAVGRMHVSPARSHKNGVLEMSTAFFCLLQFAILAYAILAGVFLAFSDFIMRSLAGTGGHGGIEAMQVINREVFRWVFMVLFIGLVPLSLFIACYGAIAIGQMPGTVMVLAGLIYVIGCFGVTVCFNVPMNNALADLEVTSKATRIYWLQTYVPRWTYWNTVRTVACAASAALLVLGLFWMAQSQAHAA